MTMTISTNPQIVMLWQGVILDFSEADSPRVQSAMYLPKMGNNALSQNCSHANNKPWRNLSARKGQGCWQFPNTITKAELLVQGFLRIVLTLLTTRTHLNPKLLITNHLDECGN